MILPAIKFKDQIHKGSFEDHHSDILAANKIGKKQPHKEGFVIGGRFYSRKYASDYMKSKGYNVPDELHSEDMRKAINDPQQGKTEKETKVKLKDVKDVVACVIDYGTFICVADTLSKTMKKVYCYNFTAEEFYSIADLCKATGLKNVVRTNDIFSPEILDTIDLFIFPDIGYEGLQKHFKTLGKAVWGSMGVDAIEILRDEFLELIKKLGLPVINSVPIKGVLNLREHLSKVKNKHVKVNIYRKNMETWHHIDIEHSQSELNRMETEFGGLEDIVEFIVQDHIDTDVETGYDGWSIDGIFPVFCSQGYEKKNELYLAALVEYKNVPDEIKEINDAIAPLLKKYGYRNFWATEIRVKGNKNHFIDPTPRMPGMSGEQFMMTCENIAEVIWKGANGIMVEPKFNAKVVAAATIYYTDYIDDKHWMVLDIPEKVRPYFKGWHYCFHNGKFHWPPKDNCELGLILGAGDNIREAIEHLKKNIELLKDEPVKFKLHGFKEILKDIVEAEKHGIYFNDQKIPDISDII
jgi:hypothetical protein